MTQANTRPAQSAPASTTLLLVSLGLGLVTIVLINIYMTRVRTEVYGDTFTVYRLTRSLQPGDKVQNIERDLRVVQVPSDFEDAFSTAISPQNVNSFVGQELLRAATAGDVLTYSLYTPLGGAPDDTLIRPGYRKISLPVNYRLVPKDLRPGMYVDLAGAFPLGGDTATPLWIMDRVKVLAVGSHTLADEETEAGRTRRSSNYRTIDIEVLPDEALQLFMITSMSVGDLHLSERNPSDRNVRAEGQINPVLLDMIKRRQAAGGSGSQ